MILVGCLSQVWLDICSYSCNNCLPILNGQVLHRRNRSGIDFDFPSNKSVRIWKTRCQGKRFYFYFVKIQISSRANADRLHCQVQRCLGGLTFQGVAELHCASFGKKGCRSRLCQTLTNTRPFSDTARRISAKADALLLTNIKANWHSTTSKLLSGTGSRSAFPSRHSIANPPSLPLFGQLPACLGSNQDP